MDTSQILFEKNSAIYAENKDWRTNSSDLTNNKMKRKEKLC